VQLQSISFRGRKDPADTPRGDINYGVTTSSLMGAMKEKKKRLGPMLGGKHLYQSHQEVGKWTD